jgi:hypothetical protein
MYEPMPVVDHERISEAISTALKELSPDVFGYQLSDPAGLDR